MKVSIIIPIYNVEPYIERCLISVFNQTYQDLEIILVDDCGNDNSMAVVEHIIKSHPNNYKIYILKHEYNRGLSVARNTGIEAATGEYLFFLDSDDALPTDSIEKLSVLLENQKLDFVIGNYNTVNGIKNRIPLKQGILLGNDKIFNGFSSGNWNNWACNKLLNKNFILNNKLFFLEGLINEDNLWSFMLACQAKSIGFAEDYTYDYYMRPDSISYTVYEKRLPHLLRIAKEMVKYAESNGLSQNVDVYNYIEQFKMGIFSDIIKECNSANRKQIYSFFRENILPCPLRKNTSIKKFIKNIHYIFHPSLGYFIFKLIINICLLRAKKRWYTAFTL